MFMRKQVWKHTEIHEYGLGGKQGTSGYPHGCITGNLYKKQNLTRKYDYIDSVPCFSRSKCQINDFALRKAKLSRGVRNFWKRVSDMAAGDFYGRKTICNRRFASYNVSV